MTTSDLPNRILIVEDESIVRLHLQRIVTSMGCAVTGAVSNAEEALASVAQDPPDLVLMDIRLTGTRNGIETAEAIRSLHDVAVVFVTAYADDRTVEQTRAAEPVGYIVKPFSDREVRAVVSTALAEYERVRKITERARSLYAVIGGIGEAVFVVDGERRVAFMNPRARDLTGFSPDAAVGRPVAEIVRVNEEDGTELDLALDRSLEKGEPHSLSSLSVYHAGGAGRSVAGRFEPLVDINGTAPGVVMSFREISNRWDDFSDYRDGEDENNKRMLIYSHDTFGLGHLKRSLNLTRALISAHPDLSILLVTGSSLAHRYQLPPRVDYVKLPTVRKVGREQYEPRSLNMSGAGIRNIRSNLLLRTIQDYSPNLVLVDHSPVGMKGELRPALEWLDEHRPECVKILGLRDIIDEPGAVSASWERDGIYDVLDRLYDQVVIYGSPSLFDPVTEYRFPRSVASRSRYLNFVGEARPERDDPPATRAFGATERSRILVTIGGGDGAADDVIGTYLDMLEALEGASGAVEFESVVLPGPLVARDTLETIRARCARLGITLHDFVNSSSPFMEAADLVICTAGYNTTVQVLQYARRALLIPRIMHRREQLLRATTLAELGLVETVHPNELDRRKLYKLITAQLSSGVEPLVEARRRAQFRFDGASVMAQFCGLQLERKRQIREGVND